MAIKSAVSIALLSLIVVYFWNPFDAPSWGPMARFTGRQYFTTPGQGMQPAFEPGSNVLICFNAFKERRPEVNDIVVFRVPGDEKLMFLKRVAAVAGSTLEIRDSLLLVDGRAVAAPFWQAGEQPSPYSTTLAPTTVPAEHFFALGDNLEQSIDSRRIGTVPVANVIGGLCGRLTAPSSPHPEPGIDR